MVRAMRILGGPVYCLGLAGLEICIGCAPVEREYGDGTEMEAALPISEVADTTEAGDNAPTDSAQPVSLGGECQTNQQCGAAVCVDAVCCATSCAADCQSCAVPGFEGQCVAIVGGGECSSASEGAASEERAFGELPEEDSTDPVVPIPGSEQGGGVRPCPVVRSEDCLSCAIGATCSDDGQCLLPVVAGVSAGGGNSCVLESNGQVRCWGINGAGELGLGTLGDIGDNEVPSSVSPVSVGGVGVARLSTGLAHSCALSLIGEIRCWGSGAFGRLGGVDSRNVGDDEFPSDVPPVNLGCERAFGISAGESSSCALMANGGVRCWGDNSVGQLGLGHTEPVGGNQQIAALVSLGGERASQVSVGTSHACAVMTGGNVRCWGRGENGVLGGGNVDDIGDDELPSSVAVVDLGGVRVSQVAAGGFHTCALTSQGAVHCWGLNVYGELGTDSQQTIGDDEAPGTAQPVDLGGEPAVHIAVGNFVSCALMNSAEVRCWGFGFYGSLGGGNTDSIGAFTPVSSIPPVDLGGVGAVDVAVGATHTCALLANDEVRCWGENSFGQLGLGNTDSIGDDELPSSVAPVQL